MSSTWVMITLILFVLVYGVFGVIDGVLMVRYTRRQAVTKARRARPQRPVPDWGSPTPDETPVLTY